MQKQDKNLFQSKFRLLNSQEYNEDIKWTSSSSSENENKSYEKINYFHKTRERCKKRKRKNNCHKDVSNLDITIIEPGKNRKSEAVLEKSPILKSKSQLTSPILKSSKFPPNKSFGSNSPILSCKRLQSRRILLDQTFRNNQSERVRKKLSYAEDNNNHNYKKKEDCMTQRNILNRNDLCSSFIKSESNSISLISESDSSMKTKLIDKVFNNKNNFSPGNTSQDINDTPTSSENTKSEEIDILSCKSLTVSPLQIIKFEVASNSDTSSFDTSTKKIKYKKGGLAYRLHALLKKQNAQISLWQHERFLAVNSNFVIPKEEYINFRIKKIDFKYGCYLLSAVDLECNEYLLLLNKKYVIVNIAVESVFKLYEPYKILPLDQNIKIIIGICKFECSTIAMK